MPRTPKTYDDLRTDCALTVREALTAAAALPNLPDGEYFLRLTGYGSGYYSEPDEVEHFKKYHEPICPDSNVYRVAVDHDESNESDVVVEPVPHGRRSYTLTYADFVLIQPTAADEYGFDDVPYATLTDFGTPSPYFSSHVDDDGFDRHTRLPV